VLSLGLWYGASGQRAAVALLGVAAVLIVPISFLLYSMIERRFIRIGGRFNLASPRVAPVRIPDYR
jgi:peptidoglycan/LPS O-acetylase OafA/YrhL